MLDLSPEGLFVFAVGHLIAAEHGRLRRHLLYLFARYIELPLLFLAYHLTVGDLRFLTAWGPARRVIGRVLGYPIARWVDTGSPAPTADVLDLLRRQDAAIAVGPCRCRTAHGRCGHRMDTDIVIRTGTPAWLRAFPDQYRVISREEAARIVEECARAGMFHMVFVHCRLGGAMNEYVLCNCCRDGCSVYLANYHVGQERFPLIPGNYYAVLRGERCEACGACVAACPWDARTLADGRPAVNLARCFGCGLCARACPTGNTVMVRKPGRLPFRTDLEEPDPSWPPTAPPTGSFGDAAWTGREAP